jgi:hypothetical protein
VHETQVVNVEPIGPNRLAVHFADGLAGEVEFRDSFFFGVFAALRDPRRSRRSAASTASRAR